MSEFKKSWQSKIKEVDPSHVCHLIVNVSLECNSCYKGKTGEKIFSERGWVKKGCFILLSKCIFKQLKEEVNECVLQFQFC